MCFSLSFVIFDRPKPGDFSPPIKPRKQENQGRQIAHEQLKSIHEAWGLDLAVLQKTLIFYQN
jgi:hypothetical protein